MVMMTASMGLMLTRRAFLTSGAPQQPLAEFVAADNFDETRELLSVIRGRGGTARRPGTLRRAAGAGAKPPV